ncbi:MAG: hypothetical protein M3Y55_06645, partial [Pseudomonadota bacterium]|nr:hypothetical protein [Pseudomonadota bacterium]
VLGAVLAGSGVAVFQARRATEAASKEEVVRTLLIDMFRLSDPSHAKGENLRASDVLDAGIEHADKLLTGDPELHADVMMNIAKINRELGRYAKAKDILVRAASIYETAGSKRDWAAVEVEVAYTDLTMGDGSGASTVMDLVGPTLGRLLVDHKLQARQHEVIGWIALSRGELREAKSEMESSLNSALVAYGRESSRTADALRGLASAEEGLGEFDNAEVHIRQAYDAARRASDVTPIDLIGIEAEQIAYAADAGRLAQAEPMMEAALQHCDAALGASHENCLFEREAYANLLLQLGRFERSATLLPALLRRAEDPSSPRRQAEAVIASSRILSANDMLGTTPGIFAKLKGMAGDDKLFKDLRSTAELTVVEIALRQSRADDAIVLTDQLLAAVRRREGSTTHARLLVFRGVALQLLGRNKDALQTFENADDEYVATLGANNTTVWLYRMNQVPSLVATGEGEKARRILEEGLPRLRESLPADAPTLLRAEELRHDLELLTTGKPSTARKAVFFLC